MQTIMKIRNSVVTSFFILGLLFSSSAKAIPMEDIASLVAHWGNFAEGVAQTAIQDVTAVKTSIMEALEKASWVKQLKSMYETYQNAVDMKEKLTQQLSGLTDVSTLVTDVIDPTKSNKNAVFAYAAKAPDSYVPKFDCNAEGVCASVDDGNGYKGLSSGVSSTRIRETYKAMPRDDSATIAGIPLSAIFPKSVELKYAEAAETNAQQIAVIHAMALEAYTQANNRIEKIQELRDLISKANNVKPGEDNTNNLKRIADLQAQIQSYEANLQNEQSKLASLAILQQSQKDGYEQHKREIMNTMFRSSKDETNSGILGFSSESLKRGAILGASWGALQFMASGSNPADPLDASSTASTFKVNVPNCPLGSTDCTPIVVGNTNKTLIQNGQQAINNKYALIAANQSQLRAINTADAAAQANAALQANAAQQAALTQAKLDLASQQAAHNALLASNANVGATNVNQVDAHLSNAETAGKSQGRQETSSAKTNGQPIGTASVQDLQAQGQRDAANANATTVNALSDNTAALNKLISALANSPSPTVSNTPTATTP